MPPVAELVGVLGRATVPAPAGLADPLVVTDPTGWTPASLVVDGPAFETLLAVAHRHWPAAPHTELALAFKAYSYWLCTPAVVGWAVSRRVPVVDPSNVLVDLGVGPVPMRVGLRRPRLVVLAGDPLAAAGRRGVTVVADECALLDVLRSQLLDRHLLPLARRAHGHRRLGVRPLLGTVAAGVANAVVRTGGTVEQVNILLDALGIADLVEVGGDPPAVRRQTCCLAFTLPRPRLCASCCLRR